MLQNANRYHFTESDEFDVRGDDSLRLVWDHPSHPWRWSASITGLGGSFGEPVDLDANTHEVDWPYKALLRHFDLGEGDKPYPLDYLFRLSPERLRMAAVARKRLEPVVQVVGRCPVTRMNPGQFFISWSGVPTLAFTGFSQHLLDLKTNLEQAIVGVGRENPGAKWPKMTIGALRDGRVLTLEEATMLRSICDRLLPAVKQEPAIDILELSFVIFACRSLERRLLTYTIRLRSDALQASDGSEPPLEHRASVDSVMAQFGRSNLQSYLSDLQRQGNREPHYREPHVEATLVFDFNGKAPRCIRDFKSAVDAVFHLLTNPAYVGKVRHKTEVYDGEHKAIVDLEIWRRVQQLLTRNGRTGGAAVRNRYGALLKGLIRCVPCGCAMGHSYSSKDGNIKYRYYVCMGAQKRGWHTCPSKSIPAAEIERLVVEQIKAIGRDPRMLGATLKHTRKQATESIAALEIERAALERELARHYKEVRALATDASTPHGAGAARLGELNERIRVGEQAMTQMRERAVALSRQVVDEREVAGALAAFDPVWETLSPKEQARVVQLLVQQIDYDGSKGTLAVTFRPDGLKSLAAQAKEVAA